MRAEVLAAAALLTRLPVGGRGDRAGAAAFGAVGAGLGTLAAAPVILLGGLAPLPAAILAVGVLAVASGVLHLDGLADTADALAAPAAVAERARSDSAVGAAGAAAIAIVVALDATLIGSVVDAHGIPTAAASVVGAATSSRAAAAVAPAVLRRPTRPGAGAWFATATNAAHGAVAAATSLAVAATLTAATGSPVAVVGAIAGLIAGAAASLTLGRLRRGLDGDGIGAVVEIAFAGSLLAAAVT